MAGDYSDMVCFVPVVTLNSATLQEHFHKVCEELENLGFKTLLVITDNHKTNVKFFTTLSGGEMKTKVIELVSRPLYLTSLIQLIQTWHGKITN